LELELGHDTLAVHMQVLVVCMLLGQVVCMLLGQVVCMMLGLVVGGAQRWSRG